jgi:2'-5' RNA ligase
MTLLVVAYPELAPADLDWIEALRQRYDPHSGLIAPHWTLVFPVADIAAEPLVAHVAAQVRGIPPIQLTIRCATIVKDVFSPLTHLFLVPDEGNGALIRLHDALYSGLLAGALRLDVPFIPHITVGAFAEAAVAKAVAGRINHEGISIHGRIGALDIISHQSHTVTTVGRVPLM